MYGVTPKYFIVRQQPHTILLHLPVPHWWNEKPKDKQINGSGNNPLELGSLWWELCARRGLGQTFFRGHNFSTRYWSNCKQLGRVSEGCRVCSLVTSPLLFLCPSFHHAWFSHEFEFVCRIMASLQCGAIVQFWDATARDISWKPSALRKNMCIESSRGWYPSNNFIFFLPLLKPWTKL